LLSLEVQDTGVTVSIDENPVAGYAFFCEQYNMSKNIVDNTAYEVPNVQTIGYRLYRYTHEWSPCPCDSIFWNRVNSDSYCGPCDCFGRVLVTFSPFTVMISGFISIVLFFTSSAVRNEHLNPARVFLSITVVCLLIILFLLTYEVCYLKSFFTMVRRNFTKVPRSKVLSNMVWVPGNHICNKHLEISGHIAAALKRGQLSYDQINDRAVLSSLSIQVDVDLEPVKIMIYTNYFVEYLDNYRDGFVRKVNFLVLTIILSIVFITMLVSIASRR